MNATRTRIAVVTVVSAVAVSALSSPIASASHIPVTQLQRQVKTVEANGAHLKLIVRKETGLTGTAGTGTGGLTGKAAPSSSKKKAGPSSGLTGTAGTGTGGLTGKAVPSSSKKKAGPSSGLTGTAGSG